MQEGNVLKLFWNALIELYRKAKEPTFTKFSNSYLMPLKCSTDSLRTLSEYFIFARGEIKSLMPDIIFEKIEFEFWSSLDVQLLLVLGRHTEAAEVRGMRHTRCRNSKWLDI